MKAILSLAVALAEEPQQISVEDDAKQMRLYFDAMHQPAIDKQKLAGVHSESDMTGPLSGLPWVSKSTPITAPEIIEHLLLNLHHQISYLALHPEESNFMQQGSSLVLNAEKWHSGRQAVLGWDVLFGFECARDLMKEVENLSFYLQPHEYRNPNAAEHPDVYHWTDFHLGSFIGRTFASCLPRCPDPEFLMHQHDEFRRPLSQEEKDQLKKDQAEWDLYLANEAHQHDHDASVAEADGAEEKSKEGDGENTFEDVHLAKRALRVPVYCLDWSDAYLRMAIMKEDHIQKEDKELNGSAEEL